MGEGPPAPRKPRAAFMPAKDPGLYWRQKMEAAEDNDVTVRFDLEKKCLIVEKRLPSTPL